MTSTAVPKSHTVAPGVQCSIYVERSLYREGVKGKTPCRERVAFWIYAPDGKPVPGGSVCAAHGAAIHNEYQEKLGEDWPLVPVEPLISFEPWRVAIEARLYARFGRLLKDTRGLDAATLLTWWADRVSIEDAADRLEPFLASVAVPS